MNIAYTTLVGTDSYVLGALCLAESYRRLHLPHDFIFLINENIKPEYKKIIKDSGLGLSKEIPNIKYNSEQYTRMHSTTGKFEVFNLVEYDRVIFLDADTLLKKPIDNITKQPFWFTYYGEDNTRPYCMCFSITPSVELYNHIQTIIKDKTKHFLNDEDVFDYLSLETNTEFETRKNYILTHLFHDTLVYGAGGDYPKYWMGTDINEADIKAMVNEKLQ